MIYESGVPSNQLNFIIAGHSRGSGLASLTALYLRESYPDRPIDVFTYSTMQLFDQRGAENYERVFENHHWSFVCKNDLFPNWIPRRLGFHSVGTKSTLNPEKSTAYKQRVSERQYVNLMQIPVITWLFKLIVAAKYWEAHRVQTYREAILLAFSS